MKAECFELHEHEVLFEVLESVPLLLVLLAVCLHGEQGVGGLSVTVPLSSLSLTEQVLLYVLLRHKHPVARPLGRRHEALALERKRNLGILLNHDFIVGKLRRFSLLWATSVHFVSKSHSRLELRRQVPYFDLAYFVSTSVGLEFFSRRLHSQLQNWQTPDVLPPSDVLLHTLTELNLLSLLITVKHVQLTARIKLRLDNRVKGLRNCNLAGAHRHRNDGLDLLGEGIVVGML